MKTYNDYLLGMTKLAAGRVKKTLDKLVMIDNVVKTRAEHVQNFVNNGFEFGRDVDVKGRTFYLVHLGDGSYLPITKMEYGYADWLGGKLDPDSVFIERQNRYRLCALSSKYNYPTLSEIDRKVDFCERFLRTGNPNNKFGKQKKQELDELLELKELKLSSANN